MRLEQVITHVPDFIEGELGGRVRVQHAGLIGRGREGRWANETRV